MPLLMSSAAAGRARMPPQRTGMPTTDPCSTLGRATSPQALTPISVTSSSLLTFRTTMSSREPQPAQGSGASRREGDGVGERWQQPRGSWRGERRRSTRRSRHGREAAVACRRMKEEDDKWVHGQNGLFTLLLSQKRLLYSAWCVGDKIALSQCVGDKISFHDVLYTKPLFESVLHTNFPFEKHCIDDRFIFDNCLFFVGLLGLPSKLLCY